MSLNVVVSNFENEARRASGGYSSHQIQAPHHYHGKPPGTGHGASYTSSQSAINRPLPPSPNHSEGGEGGGRGGGYQYIPYKASKSASQQSVAHKNYDSQQSLSSQVLSQSGSNTRNQFLEFPAHSSTGPPDDTLPTPSERSQSSMMQRRISGMSQSAYRAQDRNYPRQQLSTFALEGRMVRSSSLKNDECGFNHDAFPEFSDARFHFKNRTNTGPMTSHATWRMSTGSSDGSSPQGSPQHSSHSSPHCTPPPRTPPRQSSYGQSSPYHHHQQQQGYSGHQDSQLAHAHYSHSHHEEPVREDVPDEPIHMDLHELQISKARHLAAINGQKADNHTHSSNNFNPPYRSSSRHTYVESRSVAPRRVNSSESFSFASSIKCCVGAQPKKKRHHHHKGGVVIRSHSHNNRRRHSAERTKKTGSDQWVGLGSVRSTQQQQNHAYPPPSRSSYNNGGRYSPSHSIASCPHTINLSTHSAQRGSHNYSSGYSSEVESLRSMVATDDAGENSDSDLSDSEFSRAIGARGKSGGTMMMKLAKKFSKKNLPIAKDDDYLDEGEWQLTRRSNSVSRLDTLEGMRHRSLSMEHLVPADVEGGSRVSSSAAPHLSPSMPRAGFKNKLGNKRSMDPEADSILSGGLYRAGSKKNLAGGDPLDALFEAIELGKVDTVTSLLENGLVTKFTITNEDDLLPVDLSVMLGQHSITRLLLSKGAKDSSKFCRDPMFRVQRIKALIGEADRDIFKLQEEITSLGATNSSGMKDADKRYKKAEVRAHLCRVMLRNYEKADVPDPPTNVQLHVTSNRSIMVTFSEPENVNNAVVTRYKIEWGRSPDFKPVVGEFVMTDLRSTEYVIPDLDEGDTYYVRVSAYNMKGFGRSQTSVPPCASPSCWHDLDQSQPRYLGCTNSIHNVAAVFEQYIQDSSLTSPQSQPAPLGSSSAAAPGRNKSVRRTNPLSRMFSSAVKFHKSLKAGVYIASLFYSDESRLLVTTDDHIPIVEVADATGTSIGQDFVWLANLACTWENVQAMADITDSCTTSPAIQFRNMLLHAVLGLQNALGLTDLGLLHPVPYKDSQGAIVFVIVQYTRDPKAVASGNNSLKWTDLPKLWKRRGTPSRSVGLEAFPVPEQVVMDVQEIIAHHQMATNPMSKGLYLGYLKGRSSVASMKVICPREHPNVLPHLKIRNNPNLSSDEWQWLKSLQSPSCPLSLHSSCPQSLQQLLLPSLHLFLKNLGFKAGEASQHQLYVQEVIELNEDITILLVLPPADQVCTAPGSSDHFVDKPDFVALPISTFEIMQLYTYQRSFMTKFSKVRARVDVDLLASVHLLREALSKAEVKEAKEKKDKLEDFHSRTDQVWRQMRWIEEAIQTGRDHQATSDRLLPVATVSLNVEKQRVDAEEQRKRKEEALLHSKSGTAAQRGQEPAAKSRGGNLRVMLSYRTGLVRGSIVKLFVEHKTTTAEVIKLVVTQVALTSRANVETDLSDYFLVASLGGKKEKILEPDYPPLQLQLNAAETKDKVLLMVRKHSEEAHQMVTNV